MMSWVVTFLMIALVAGLLGFGGIAGASIEIAKIVFFVALILFLVSDAASPVTGALPCNVFLPISISNAPLPCAAILAVTSNVPGSVTLKSQPAQSWGFVQ